MTKKHKKRGVKPLYVLRYLTNLPAFRDLYFAHCMRDSGGVTLDRASKLTHKEAMTIYNKLKHPRRGLVTQVVSIDPPAAEMKRGSVFGQSW